MNIERIRTLLDEKELLCNLAEKCVDMSKSAMKVRRVIDGRNHAVYEGKVAWSSLYEDVAEVLLALRCLNIRVDSATIKSVQENKIRQWVCGLEENAR